MKLFFISFFTIFILFTSPEVLTQIQTDGRNITIPTSTTSTSVSATPTPSATSSNNNNNNNNNNNSSTTTSNNNNGSIGNSTTTPNTNNSTSNSSSTTTKLTPIPDATGSVNNIPVPSASGGKPNGRYGPDDQYIAGLPKLPIPLLSSLLTMASTIIILSYGSIF